MNATRREWYGQRLHVTMVPKEQSTRVFSQVDSHKQRFPEKMAALDEQIVRYCLQNIREMDQNDGEAWSIASLCPPPPLPPPTVDSETIASETKPKVDRSFLRRAFASLVFESGDDQLPATLPHNENGNFVPIANDSAQLEALTKGKIAEEMRKRRILCVIVIGIIVSVGLAHNLFVLLLLFTNFFD
ncbi:hypothetical protein QR680_002931 [Steinernema hermaphroditum]|uniref:Uncharacterized protein n=1 Tax=Steinernema hermaphroditum TaxID=289476 RepID=A0AA39LJ59_9BILA|nr:hypothetical protein QR680_002931 [Steinernema hermaphroditum]